MDRLNETDETIELGVASVETRGGGKGLRDQPDEQFPVSGLTDD